MGLVESALGKATASEVREGLLHPGTGKLVARMADGFGRSRLEQIEIDLEKLLAADTGESTVSKWGRAKRVSVRREHQNHGKW